MGAGKYDFTIEQGADFIRRITWKQPNGTPVDLTDYSASMKIKLSPKYSDHILWLTSNTTPPNPGGITLGGSGGTIDILITASQTRALDFDEAMYDLELENVVSGRVTRLLEGRVTLSREITT